MLVYSTKKSSVQHFLCAFPIVWVGIMLSAFLGLVIDG